MTQALNTQAAEHHEEAAKLHRTAAEHHGKNDHAKAKDCCNKAASKSDEAHKSSAAAKSSK
jgi:hypothetical protein